MGIRRKQFLVLFIFLMFLTLALTVHPVNAVDELYLTGIIKSIDHKSKIVVVDVKSESCPGYRRFRIDDTTDLDRLLNKRVSFFIDSSTCKGNGIYKMRLSRVSR